MSTQVACVVYLHLSRDMEAAESHLSQVWGEMTGEGNNVSIQPSVCFDGLAVMTFAQEFAKDEQVTRFVTYLREQYSGVKGPELFWSF